MKAKIYEWVIKIIYKDGWELVFTKNLTVKDFEKCIAAYRARGHKVDLLFSTQWPAAYAAKHDKRKVSA